MTDLGAKLSSPVEVRNGTQAGNVRNCTQGEDSAEHLRATSEGGYSNYLSYSRSVWGPWTAWNQTLLPGGCSSCWDMSVVNMAPFPLSNGTVLLGYRGTDSKHTEKLGVAIAANWSGPYRSLSPNAPIINASGEDPYLWVDRRGNFHILFHAFATMGGHAFSRALAGPWTLSDTVPYNCTISWSNGTTITYAERERPELLLDAVTGSPLVLYTAVLFETRNKTWGSSFTSAQGIKTRR